MKSKQVAINMIQELTDGKEGAEFSKLETLQKLNIHEVNALLEFIMKNVSL